MFRLMKKILTKFEYSQKSKRFNLWKLQFQMFEERLLIEINNQSRDSGNQHFFSLASTIMHPTLNEREGGLS